MNFNPAKIIKWFTLSVCIICALLMVNFLLYPIISPDSGFYLSVAREFYQGKTFFVEIGSIYNPLAIVTVGLPFLLDSNPNVRYHVAVNIIILVFCAFYFYRLVHHFSAKKNWNLFVSSFFLLLLLFNDGRYIVLEPLSVLFQLLALNWYLKYSKNPHFWKLLLAGIAIGLSFLSKQYGLFIVIPIGISVLLSKKNHVKQIAGIALGFVLPLTVLYLFLQTPAFTVVEFVKCMIGKGVHLDVGNGTGLELDVKSTFMFLLIFIVTNLYVILIPFYAKRITTSKHFVMLITALFSSFLVLYFAFYQHYFIYVIPYFLLLFVILNANKQSNSFQTKALSLFLISFVLIVFSVTSSFMRKKEVYFSQNNYASKLTKLVPAESNVYLDGVSPSFFYLCRYNSIHSKNVGYCFPGYLYASTIVNNMKKGDYVIVLKDDFRSYVGLVDGFNVKQTKIDNDEIFIIQK